MAKKKRFGIKSDQNITTIDVMQSVSTQEFPELNSFDSTQESTESVSVESISVTSVSVWDQKQPKSKPSNPLSHDLKSPTESETILRPKESPKEDPNSDALIESPKANEICTKTNHSKSEQLALAKEIKENLLIRAPPKRPFAKRPGFMTEGRTVTLLTNHFLLSVGNKEAFHYDIEIKAKPKKIEKSENIVDKEVNENVKESKCTKFSRKIATKLNRKIFQQMIKSYSGLNQVFYGINPVYDGQKNMFTSKILDRTGSTGADKRSIRLTVDLEENERISTFYVNIKMAETNYKIELNVLNQYHKGITCDDDAVKKSILFINTLLRHKSSMEMIPIGQSIFDPKICGQEISKFVLLSYGYYSSVRNLMIGTTLNIDRSAACFYKPSKITDFIGDILRGNLSKIPKIDDFERRQIKKALSGLQIEATHISYPGTNGPNYRKYRVLGVSINSAKDHKFIWKERNSFGKEQNKGEVSVEQYFILKYGVKLNYPQLPCLEVGSATNKVYIPLELCKVVSHQRLRRSLTNKERADMTTIAGSQTPKERLKQCQQFVSKQFNSGETANQNKPFLYEFGIDVSQQLLEVQSKVIEPPKLKYSGNKSVVPQHGEWEMYKTGSTFLRAASLKKWLIINLSFTTSFSDNDISLFAKDFCSQALEMGMNIMSQSLIVRINKANDFNPKTTFNAIKTKIQQKFSDLQMILFITPNKSDPFSDDIYSEIKLLGDVDKGFATQCVNVANIWNGRRKWNRSYLRQLMLKINPKLGGTNVALHESTPAMPSILKDKSLMIMGADVNHPAPADRITPSIAAAVGSFDNEFTNYYTTVSMQPKSREEMIKKLDQMVYDILVNYRNHQKKLPQKIIVYRDGVSEGQFQHVIDNEFYLLLEAFKKFGPNYLPKITFIIVQKRHHTRFVPKQVFNSNDPNLRFQNISAGTVVEEKITHKTDFDFYLCSHSGKIGTSRAAHYYVLTDQNDFSANEICKMTYYLCHIYARCTKSVSIPAPVYYADLAAYRAKVHASALQDSQLSSSHSVTSSDSGKDETHEENKIRTYENLIKVLPNQKQRLYFM